MRIKRKNLFFDMKKRGNKSFSCAGFTLVEVLVALTLLAVGLATMMELLSGSLSQARSSRIYTTAIFLANQKMGEALLTKEAEEVEGTFDSPYDNFNYSVEISSQQLPVFAPVGFDIQENTPPTPGLDTVKVTISWEDGSRMRKLSFTTMKTTVEKHETGL